MAQTQTPDLRVVETSEDSGDTYAVVAVDVGQDGISFMRSQMLQYGPLSRSVAELFGNGGTAFAPMLEGTTSEYAKHFDYDSVGTNAVHHWLAEYAKLRWGAGACQVIFEEPWSKMPDMVGYQETRYFGCQGFPYFAPESADLFEALEDGGSSASFLRFGFFISPPVLVPPHGGNAEPQTIDALARNTRMTFMSAYDDMGYVVWLG